MRAVGGSRHRGNCSRKLRSNCHMDAAPVTNIAGDPVFAEIESSLAPDHAPTMGVLAKVRYSHVDMIDYIIANPGVTQRDVAKRYGYTEGWVSNVMASDAWQAQMALRRNELVDPVLAATLEERFRGITMLSLEKLRAKLEAPVVSDNVVLRAVELGAKSLGLGSHAPPPAPEADHLAKIANRLIDLQSNIRKGVTINASSTLVEEA